MREKIVFFILGAVLATIAYTIGDNNSDAQNFRAGVTEFDEIQCRKLTVFGEIQANEIMVMDPIRKTGFIKIGFDKDGPTLNLMNTDNKGGIISLSASNDSAQVILSTVDRIKAVKGGMSLTVTDKASGIVIEGEAISKPRQ